MVVVEATCSPTLSWAPLSHIQTHIHTRTRSHPHTSTHSHTHTPSHIHLDTVRHTKEQDAHMGFPASSNYYSHSQSWSQSQSQGP